MPEHGMPSKHSRSKPHHTHHLYIVQVLGTGDGIWAYISRQSFYESKSFGMWHSCYCTTQCMQIKFPKYLQRGGVGGGGGGGTIHCFPQNKFNPGEEDEDYIYQQPARYQC